MTLSRNAAFTLTASLLQVVVILVTVPLYIQAIGLDRYGVTVAVWLLFDYLVILNLGLDRATINMLAGSSHDATKARQVLLSALSLMLPLGLLAGGIAALWLNDILYSWLSIPVELISEAGAARYAVALALPIYIAGGALNAALQAEERFLELSVAQFVLSLCAQVLPLLAVWLLGGTLEEVLVAGALARALQPLVMLALLRGRVVSTGTGGADFVVAARLIRFGLWASVTNLAQPLLNMDRLLLSFRLGPVALASYAIPFNLVNRVGVLPASVGSALFPRFSREPANAETLYEKVILYLNVAYTPMLVIGAALIQPFLDRWVGQHSGNDFSGIGEILVLGMWFNGLAIIPYVYLQATGRPRTVAAVHAAEVLPYLLIVWFAVQWMGPIGAAAAWAIRAAADGIALAAFAPGHRRLARALSWSLATVCTSAVVGWLVRADLLTELLLATILAGCGLFVSILALGSRLREEAFHRLRSVIGARFN